LPSCPSKDVFVGVNVAFAFFVDKPGEEEGGTDMLVVEFGFRSRLEDVLDGKREGPAKKGRRR
jgi:hypothetical protein